ncbi:hypothetical protein ASD07_19915 [Duganella sp. Root336D2]|nr:hypothetical protein ASD07_19915 [Duganella sp. Root336D2]
MAGPGQRAYSDTMFNAKRPIMKKVFALSLVLLFFCMVAGWMSIDSNDLVVTVGDSDYDGPLGALLGTMLAGGVFAALAVVMVFVAAIVAVVMAGVGVIVILSLALAAVVTMAAVSPLLLPLMIPFFIYWLMKRRDRKPAAPALEHAPA